jgi:hypothetical protein
LLFVTGQQPLRGVRSGLLRASCPPPLRGRSRALRHSGNSLFSPPAKFVLPSLPALRSYVQIRSRRICRTLGAAQHRTLVIGCRSGPSFAGAKAAGERLHP